MNESEEEAGDQDRTGDILPILLQHVLQESAKEDLFCNRRHNDRSAKEQQQR